MTKPHMFISTDPTVGVGYVGVSFGRSLPVLEGTTPLAFPEGLIGQLQAKSPRVDVVFSGTRPFFSQKIVTEIRRHGEDLCAFYPVTIEGWRDGGAEEMYLGHALHEIDALDNDVAIVRGTYRGGIRRIERFALTADSDRPAIFRLARVVASPWCVRSDVLGSLINAGANIEGVHPSVWHRKSALSSSEREEYLIRG